MVSNMDITTTIYCTKFKLDQCDEPEHDQAAPDSCESRKLFRELLSIYKDKVQVFPLD